MVFRVYIEKTVLMLFLHPSGFAYKGEKNMNYEQRYFGFTPWLLRALEPQSPETFSEELFGSTGPDDEGNIILDVPGVDPAAIEISLDRRRLVVKYERHGHEHVRTYLLSSCDDQSSCTAQYKHGVLTIWFGRTKDEGLKKIPIKVV